MWWRQFLSTLGASLANREKNDGPFIVPWGTPQFLTMGSERPPEGPRRTCDLYVRKEKNQRQAVTEKPRARSLSISRWILTRSNAGEKSIATSQTICPSSRASRMSSTIFMSTVCVLCPLRKPDCSGLSRFFTEM